MRLRPYELISRIVQNALTLATIITIIASKTLLGNLDCKRNFEMERRVLRRPYSLWNRLYEI
jgi:hypothetical protein